MKIIEQNSDYIPSSFSRPTVCAGSGDGNTFLSTDSSYCEGKGDGAGSHRGLGYGESIQGRNDDEYFCNKLIL